MNCKHCGEPAADQVPDGNRHEWICARCGAQLYSRDLQETRAQLSGHPVRIELPDRFRFEKVVGEGSFGIVSKCWDNLLHRDVAIKFPRTGQYRKNLFLREARAASRLQHENIVRILEIGEHLGQIFLVSEYVDGTTLRAWLDRNDHSTDDVLQMMVQIARGIDYAHESGVVHRDLKPGNILVNRLGQPRILDFGLSRSRHSEEDSIVKPGQQAGTPAFMSPEQVRGDSQAIDARTDVYALGVILFQLLVRQLPYSGSLKEVFRAITEDASPPSVRSRNRSVPAPLEAICLKAMDKLPERRYQTAGEFASEISRYLEGRSLQAYPGLHSRRIRKILRRNWLASAAVVSTVAAVGGVWWIARDHQLRNPRIPVVIESDPPGARLVWKRFDAETGLEVEEQPPRSLAGDVVRLIPGFYRVIAHFDSDSVEVFRSVPASPDHAAPVSRGFLGVSVSYLHRTSGREGSRVRLPEIRLVPVQTVRNEMVFFPKCRVEVDDDIFAPLLFKGRTGQVGSFLMDRQEVVWDEIAKTWPTAELPDDRQAPATGIHWDVVVAWCELNGRNLPTVWELLGAATNGGLTRYVSGDALPPVSQESGAEGAIESWDSTLAETSVRGLLTGCSEWTSTPFRVLMREESGRLVANPAGQTTTAGQTGFPDLVYVVLNQKHRLVESPTIPANLANVPLQNTIPNLGFRTVRRLFDSSLPGE